MKSAPKFVLLFFIFGIFFVLPAILIPFTIAFDTQPDPLALFVLLLIDTAAIIYLIKRLDLAGWRLFLAVIIVFWGLQTFMTQNETWYFRDAMPMITDRELANLFVRPLITMILFTPLAIWILGKWKNSANGGLRARRVLTWKEALILSASYVLIYFLFGHFVAWQFEEVRVFYSGSDAKAGFFEQLSHTVRERQSILPFQFLRGVLWIACGLPILMYLKGSRRELILACVFMYGILTTVQLIVANPFMPEKVRFAHWLEVTTSNALFGFLLGWLSTRNKKSEIRNEK
jgi:hypothetical protein